MKTWITLSVVALLPMLLRAPKALSPIRVSARDHFRLAGLFRRYRIHSFTGLASDVGKRSDSHVKGSTTATWGTDGQPGSMSTAIDTEVVVTDSFFLTDEQDQVTSFESTGFEARVGNGHIVSLARLTHGRGRSGPYFLIYDHTTGETFFSDDVIKKVLTFPYPKTYPGILFLMILPIPLLTVFGIAALWQRMKFKSKGVHPLLATLDERAAKILTQIPAQGGAPVDVTSRLSELAALRASGALSQAEFEQAKARILAVK